MSAATMDGNDGAGPFEVTHQLVLSIAIPTAFGAGGMLFALTYVAMQTGRSAFTAYVMRRDWPENSLNFTRITVWTLFSAVFWIGGAFVGADLAEPIGGLLAEERTVGMVLGPVGVGEPT